ncbi:MAG: class I SAM-dependent methyltransferase [Saprospiraceae bacterium]|nr:class I SAM-dependent methyltransferase [Saprospiraceae bacterium]
MKSIKPRIPEGGAIEDSSEMTMEQYSETMKKQLGKAYIRFAHEVINKVSPIESSKVLEIGPGPGWAGINLLKIRNDLKLEGLEASADMIRVATNNAKNEAVDDRIKFVEGIAEEMKNIPDKQYDLVISRDSLHHWVSPEKVFLQIKRVLKENGKVYIHDHKRDLNLFGKFIVNVVGKLVAGKMAKYWKSSIAAAYTKEEMQEILAKAECKNWKVNSELMDLTILKN